MRLSILSLIIAAAAQSSVSSMASMSGMVSSASGSMMSASATASNMPAVNNTLNTNTVEAVLLSMPNLSNFTAFTSLIPALSNLLSESREKTLLVPSNAAMTAYFKTGMVSPSNTSALTNLLSYHILGGMYTAANLGGNNVTTVATTALIDPMVNGNQTVVLMHEGPSIFVMSGLAQNTSVTSAGHAFDHGVIHVIDTVLTLPTNITLTAATVGASSFAGALNATNLTETIMMTPSLTYFVPSNVAFSQVGSLFTSASNMTISSLLQYHMIKGIEYTTDLSNGQVLTSMSGGLVRVVENNGVFFVNTAEVLVPNILVENGVIHIIDSVLNPNATLAETTPNVSAVSRAPALTGASKVSVAPFASLAPSVSSTEMSVAAKASGGMQMSSASAAASSVSAAASSSSVIAAGGTPSSSKAFADSLRVPVYEMVIGAIVYVLV